MKKFVSEHADFCLASASNAVSAVPKGMTLVTPRGFTTSYYEFLKLTGELIQAEKSSYLLNFENYERDGDKWVAILDKSAVVFTTSGAILIHKECKAFVDLLCSKSPLTDLWCEKFL